MANEQVHPVFGRILSGIAPRDPDDAPEPTEADLLAQAAGISILLPTRAHIRVLCAELKREQQLRFYAERRIAEWQEALRKIKENECDKRRRGKNGN